MNKKYYITVLIIIILIVMVLITGVLLSKKEKQENASDELQIVEESKDEVVENEEKTDIQNLIDNYEEVINNQDIDGLEEIIDFDDELAKELSEENLEELLENVNKYEIYDFNKIKEKSEIENNPIVVLGLVYDVICESYDEIVKRGYEVYLLSVNVNDEEMDDLLVIKDNKIIMPSILLYLESEKEVNAKLDELEIRTFNFRFKQYEGRIMGESVIELLDKLIVNALTYGDSDERLPDVIYIDGRTDGQITKDDVEGSESLSNSEMEEVEIAEFDKENAQFIVRSDSDLPNRQAIGRIRKIIERKHYYNVYFTNNDITGLIEYVFIEY